ncbi:autotransporter outer membrane beta-barrel domain-containing protein [Stenotrophomonas maltophilia]|jgi:autotransporter family porin|uniref:Autotransporter outer membrane beta-barrel domain-containing protein n=1 Tax=Stenotrophomonas maltophilia TaxID=40324 RepID=A0A2J0SR27_STEMA|nr:MULTISPECIES: autotransporter outer membrane beta-barrel domain-containing protein [Stenotrophomonas]MBA0309683.1 autotransporter outer membrane beta-barrel domain-containing protein [Stenotrophomonas maltophilia]MDQ7304039.1 autotransporter outer membrane beta-barrel domain-containing protein [Stenotrophomonas sp. Sm0581]PJK99718.1 hypothetical protein B9Y57_19170 [Stenotrophomonas maltophilia]PJL27627.1 hypothetical protein B9Y65_18520 [Stenotrophomonas maltophilia]PJL63235.1 hypothetical
MAGDLATDAVQLGSARAAVLLALRAHDRRGTLTLEDGRNAWVRVATLSNNAYESGAAVQLGSDVLQSSHVLMGVMVGSSRSDGHVVSTASGRGGKERVQGTTVGVYGTWLQQADGAAGAYLDASLQAAQFRSHVYGASLT